MTATDVPKDSHFRVGGAKGTNLQASDCPKLTGSVNPRCIAASMLLHVTSGASGYFENMWAWVADHDLDSSLDQTQIDIYVARGQYSCQCFRLLDAVANPAVCFSRSSD